MNDPRLYVDHILDCISKIERFCADGEDAFLASELIQDACLRNLQIIAQSAGRIPDDLRKAGAEVDWDLMRGFRNRVVHDYFEVSIPQVWYIIQNDLPVLKTFTARCLEELGG
ncbi:DUF86 domain-containing protein [bacterium]|nr:DUF86 domain-containing protein [bacterium]